MGSEKKNGRYRGRCYGGVQIFVYFCGFFFCVCGEEEEGEGEGDKRPSSVQCGD
jgi:hypothetical protein